MISYRHVALGAVALFVAVAANMSSGILSQGGPAYHIAAFAALGALMRYALKFRHFIPSLIVLVAFGILIEILQNLVGGQHAAEFKDVIANALGALLGMTSVSAARYVINRTM